MSFQHMTFSTPLMRWTWTQFLFLIIQNRYLKKKSRARVAHSAVTASCDSMANVPSSYLGALFQLHGCHPEHTAQTQANKHRHTQTLTHKHTHTHSMWAGVAACLQTTGIQQESRSLWLQNTNSAAKEVGAGLVTMATYRWRAQMLMYGERHSGMYGGTVWFTFDKDGSIC